MFHTIMVPLDTSAFSEHALPLAQSIARNAPTDRPTTLHLVHVHVPVYRTLLNDANVGGVPILDETADAESQQREHDHVAMLRTTLGPMPGVEVWCTLLHGPIAAALTEHADAIGADLIVMTTHGRGGMGRAWLGSVADAVMRHGCIPVLIVRPHEAAPAPAQEMTTKRILVPLDGSPLAEQALEPARKLDPSGMATFVLMHAIPPFVFGGYLPYIDVDELDLRSTQRQRAKAQAYLERVAGTLRAEGRQAETVLCSKQQSAVAILEAAREQRADAIALATHGRGGVRRWLLGSVADKVVRAAHIPVLLHHPQ